MKYLGFDNYQFSAGEPILRSCWTCNSAHEHLKYHPGLHLCFLCGGYYIGGHFMDEFDDIESMDAFLQIVLLGDETLRETVMDKREKLAEYAHASWAGWMKYLFDISDTHPSGSEFIPRWAVDRWLRQMNTSYKDLPEGEKESDRAEADRMLAIINETNKLEEIPDLANAP